jgi:hypothetical protein
MLNTSLPTTKSNLCSMPVAAWHADYRSQKNESNGFIGIAGSCEGWDD